MVKYGTQVKTIEAEYLLEAESQINDFIKNKNIWKIIPVDHESKFAFMIWYIEDNNSN